MGLLKQNGPVLVVAAHADDEALGCGGLMAKLAAAGRSVHVVFMTDGVSARGEGDADGRQSAASQAAAVLGAHEPVGFDFPDNAMDSVPLIEIVKAIESEVARVQPTTVLTHHHGDLNVDHQVVHRAVLTACRPQPGCSVRELLSFSVRSSTEWGVADPVQQYAPTVFVDISEALATKMKALQCYTEEMRAAPHSRSLEAVEAEAIATGAQVGVAAAEAFGLIRCVCHGV
ncbi:MAG: PIG-L family deacetylase [Phycisphaerales bacterium]|nr:PIG-L family deacetylase [Phycisphaerales bacterium]